MLRLTVDPDDPAPATIERAARRLRDGAVAAIPTDTFYGLAANPFDTVSVDRIFRAKGRRDDKPLPLVAANAEQIAETLGALPPGGARLAVRYWPGPLTLLIEPSRDLAAGVSAGSGRVGVRVPACAVARRLCAACGMPLTATSANLSGEPATNDPAVVWRTLHDRIDLFVDAGLTPGGPPSTIVDVTGAAPVLVRAGAIAWEDILHASTVSDA
jgi:L-threonylcarbamoyladenylate synthase